MTMHGADPEQLAQLGRTLRTQIDSIDGVISVVGSALANTLWQGPARDRFAREWDESFTLALVRLKEAFGAAGSECVTRADELRRVMGT